MRTGSLIATAIIFYIKSSLLFSQVYVSPDTRYNKGYIFNDKGDTVTGWVGTRNEKYDIARCIFKPDIKDEPGVLKASDISGYFSSYGNKTYVSCRIRYGKRDTTAFARLYFEGEYDLLYYEQGQVRHFLVKRPDNTYYDLSYPPVMTPDDYLKKLTVDKKFRLSADSIFNNPDLPEIQKGVKPEIGSFVNLFREFHQATHQAYEAMTSTNVSGSVQKSGRYLKGFLINQKGDTISGFLGKPDRKTLNMSVNFKPGRHESPVKMTPAEITAFGSPPSNSIFSAVQIPSGKKELTAFSRLLVDGKYDLLYYERLGVRHFLIRKPDSYVYDIYYPHALSSKEYLSGLSGMRKFRQSADSIFTGEASNIQLKNIRPSINSMVKLFRENHENLGEPFKVYYNPRMIYYAGVTAGVKFDRYLVNVTNNGFKSFSSPSPYAGLVAWILNKNREVGLVAETTFGIFKHNYSYLISEPLSNDYYETSLTGFSSISRLGLMMNPLPALKSKLFIDCGPQAGLLINQKYENYVNKVSIEDNTVLSYNNQEKLNSGFFYGAYIRAGVIPYIRGLGPLKASAGFELMRNPENVRINAINISCTYYRRSK